MVAYVPPGQFDEAMGILRHLRDTPARWNRPILIGGASGVGKTRMALELARAFQGEVAGWREKSFEVQFLSLTMSDAADDDDPWLSPADAVDAAKKLAMSLTNDRRLIIELARKCSRVAHKVGSLSPDLRLDHVLKTMFSQTSTQRFLFLNIDECHRNMQKCSEIIRTIRNANNAMTDYCIVPVATGIWMQDADMRVITDVSRTLPFHTVLHFLPSEKVGQLVQRLVEAVEPPAAALLQETEAKVLIRDTAGWARAAVTLALRICSEHKGMAGKISWQELEKQYELDMAQQYGDKRFAEILSGMSYLSKLLDTALAPHSV